MTDKTNRPPPEPGDRFAGRCRSCDAPIVMVYMSTNKWHPCDGTPQKLVTESGEIVSGIRSHFGTCPDAKDWRKDRANAG